LKTSEGDLLSVPSAPPEARPTLLQRWSGEDETWDSMIAYIRVKCEDELQMMEDVESPPIEDVDIESIISGGSEKGGNIKFDSTKDAIQQRMSISNLL
jgi:hypothetical protein